MANFTTFDFGSEFDITTTGFLNLTDLTSYIGGGAALVQGINFKVEKVYGATNMIIHENTSWVTPDINPDVSPDAAAIGLPVFNGEIAWGLYRITGTIKDEDGTLTTLIYTFTLCKPECDCGCDGSTGTTVAGNTGCASVEVKFDCVQSVVFIQDTTSFVYKTVQGTPTYSIVVKYPTDSGVSDVTSTIPSFILSPVYNGEYTFVQTDTAIYEFDDNISVIVKYKKTTQKNSYCSISLCNIWCAYDAYVKAYDAIKGKGTVQERTYEKNLFRLSILVPQVMLGLQCGNDVGDLVDEIESIIGGDCNCGCGTAIPATGQFTLQNISITGATPCDGDITVTTTTVGNNTTVTIKDVTYVISAAVGQEGITITSSTTGCTKTYYLAICPEELLLCDSTGINSINPTTYATVSTPISAGTPLGDEITEIGDSIDTLIAAIQNIIAVDIAGLQADIDALAVESWKTFGGGGTFVNGQSVPALNAAINPAANTSWTDAGGTTFKDTDIGMTLRARYNPQTNMVDINGTITITAGAQNAIITTMPTGYIPTRQQSIQSVCMDTSVGNSAHDSNQPIFVYVRSNGQIRCAVNTPLSVGTDYVICYINGSYALN